MPLTTILPLLKHARKKLITNTFIDLDMNPEQGLEVTGSLTTILLPRAANNAGATTAKMTHP